MPHYDQVCSALQQLSTRSLEEGDFLAAEFLKEFENTLQTIRSFCITHKTLFLFNMFFETTGNEYIMKQLRKETTGHGHELSPKTGLRVSFKPNASRCYAKYPWDESPPIISLSNNYAVPKFRTKLYRATANESSSHIASKSAFIFCGD